MNALPVDQTVLHDQGVVGPRAASSLAEAARARQDEPRASAKARFPGSRRAGSRRIMAEHPCAHDRLAKPVALELSVSPRGREKSKR